MATKIGDVQTVGKVTDFATIPDDRQLIQPLVDPPYNAAIDNGYHETGDTYTFSCVLSVADFATVKGYWINRTKVTVVNEDGEALSSCRIRILSYKPKEGFEKTYKTVSIGIWRV